MAAVEFALIVPLMLLLYLGTLEISAGISLNKRVARAASTTADLVTQTNAVTRADLDNIMRVGESILFPYQFDKPQITVVGIDVHSSFPMGGRVVWSRRLNKNGSFQRSHAPGADIHVPDRLRVDGAFLVMSHAELTYLPVVPWVTGRPGSGFENGIDMGQRYWFYPRLVDRIECSDC